MPSFATDTLSKKQSYKLMTSAIVPRPIAWVSTRGENGIYNLAPFSFFNGVAVMPPTIGFTVAFADDDRGFKDTYRNITTTRECVVNVVTEPNAHAMNISAKAFSADIDEFTQAGVTPIASEIVKAPRVQESPVQFECRLNQVVTLENALGRSDLMLCDILMIHVAESVYLGDYKIDQHALQAIGRMGGTHYTETRDLFDMTRYHTINNNKSE